MNERAQVTPESLINVSYPPGRDPEVERPAFIGIAWHRLGLCVGKHAANIFGTYRVMSEHPDLLDQQVASEAEEAFISLLGFSPAELLAVLYATEHAYNFPSSYMREIPSAHWAREESVDSD